MYPIDAITNFSFVMLWRPHVLGLMLQQGVDRRCREFENRHGKLLNDALLLKVCRKNTVAKVSRLFFAASGVFFLAGLNFLQRAGSGSKPPKYFMLQTSQSRALRLQQLLQLTSD